RRRRAGPARRSWEREAPAQYDGKRAGRASRGKRGPRVPVRSFGAREARARTASSARKVPHRSGAVLILGLSDAGELLHVLLVLGEFLLQRLDRVGELLVRVLGLLLGERVLERELEGAVLLAQLLVAVGAVQQER